MFPNIIFFWNIFWCFYLTHLLQKAAHQTSNTEIEKTLKTTHKHALEEKTCIFLAAALSVASAGVQLSAVCARDLLGIRHSALSFRFVLHWLSHGKQLHWFCQ